MRSHQRAFEATKSKAFANEIIPIQGLTTEGNPQLCSTDEVIRPDTNMEGLTQLRPVFDPVNGTVTAGNASAISDGAACLLVMSARKRRHSGCSRSLKFDRFLLWVSEPSIMGIGPVPAVKKALKQAELKLQDIDLFELNEAFAGQSLAVVKGLGLDDAMEERINLNGGAIALGHPLGCSGARISTTLMHLMQFKNKNLGVATMCAYQGVRLWRRE